MSAAPETLSTGHSAAEAHGAHGTTKGMDAALMGVMLFIASEVMFFAALFGAYFNVKATTKPFPPEGTEHFITPWGAALLITIVLVLSSFTMQWATMRIRKGDRTGMNRGIAVTLLLGISFFLIVGYEYYVLIYDDHFTISSGVYGTLFFTMTGFHAAHVLGGVIGMAVVLARGVAGQFSARHHSAVEAIHYYWHFVDIVWVFLFLTIYVLR